MFSARWSPRVRDGTRIGSHAEMLGHPRLHRRPLRAERGKGAGAAAEHRHEKARRRLLQPLDMAEHLVDPHRRLVAEGRRQRVLAMGASGDRHVGAALGEVGHRREGLGDQPQKDSDAPGAIPVRSPVCVMFCVVAPQCTQPPWGSPVTRLNSQTSGTIVCPVRANPSSMRAAVEQVRDARRARSLRPRPWG